MFQSIRRHQKWLWAVITTVVIISFVVFFSPNQGAGRGGMHFQSVVGTLDGQNLTREDYVRAHRESTLRFLFSYGQWPRSSEINQQNNVVERETRNRLVLLNKIKELNITVSERAVADWITESAAFRDRDTKTFRKEIYDEFVNNNLPREGLSKADFERFVRNEVAIQHLVAVFGGVGKLVTPQEAEASYRQENEMADTQGVFWSSSNYLGRVTMDPSALSIFYTNRQATYRLPERLQVSYVAFERSNYLAEATQRLTSNTNFDQVISATYAQRGASYVDAAGKPLPLEEAKAKIRTELFDYEALVTARRKAIDFANELFEKTPMAASNLETLAAAKGIPVKVTAPFSEYEDPAGLTDPPGNFSQVAFGLSPEQPFSSEPLLAESTVYMIAYKARIPSEVPSLESIRARVVDDFQRTRANEMAQTDGRQFYATLTNGLAQGKTFEAAAKEAGLTPVDFAPFAQNATILAELPPGANLASVKSVAFTLQPGKPSTFIPAQNGGFILFLQNRVPVADTVVQAELPEYLKTLRQSRQYEAFSDWFRHESETAKLTLEGDNEAAVDAAAAQQN